MSRYQNTFVSSKNDGQLKVIAEDYFSKEGFKLIKYKGEMVFKKGVGFLTAPQYIKLTFQNSNVTLEAFLKYPIFIGVYVGEMGLKGFVAALPKGLLQSKVNTLESLLR